MAEKGAKKKKAKGDANVLASLPTTRPNRLGRHARGSAATAAATPVKAASPKPARKSKPKAKAAAAKPAPKLAVAEAPAQKPRPVRSASKKLAEPARKSAAKRAPAPPPPDKAPSGTELVTTVVQAAGELASVGLSIGGQIVKRAVDRLPRP